MLYNNRLQPLHRSSNRIRGPSAAPNVVKFISPHIELCKVQFTCDFDFPVEIHCFLPSSILQLMHRQVGGKRSAATRIWPYCILQYTVLRILNIFQFYTVKQPHCCYCQKRMTALALSLPAATVCKRMHGTISNSSCTIPTLLGDASSPQASVQLCGRNANINTLVQCACPHQPQHQAKGSDMILTPIAPSQREQIT